MTKLGMFVWLVFRKTFNDSAVAPCRFAIASKLGAWFDYSRHMGLNGMTRLAPSLRDAMSLRCAARDKFGSFRDSHAHEQEHR
jgi:hypothetical protein